MVILNPKAFQSQARSLVQELITGVQQSQVEAIRNSVKNPLIFHNLVIYKGHLLRAAFKEKKGLENMVHRFFLKSKLRVFSDQIFERHFNSNDRRELLELSRNFRVLGFFVEDCFVHQFEKRPNWHVLYEDVFFQNITEEEAQKIGILYESLFEWCASQKTITADSLRAATQENIKFN